MTTEVRRNLDQPENSDEFFSSSWSSRKKSREGEGTRNRPLTFLTTQSENGEKNMTGTSTKEDENRNPGPDGSGEKGTGPEFPEASEEKIAVRKKTVPLLVERVTALRGQSIARPRQSKSVLRRQTPSDIFGKDPEIPYVKFEGAARDLVCSLIERQDRMNEEIFNRINDLGYRLEDLEQEQAVDGGRR